jgi:putative aldouronate transport system substrate-binding protein
MFLAFITTACQDLDGAYRYLDFGYSEKGKEMFNYGKEGISFNYINYEELGSPVDLSAFGDKFPRWAPVITENPDHALAEILSLYIRAHSSGPFPQDEGYLVQFMKYSDQLKTIETWNGATDYYSTIMPRLYFTTEESDTLAAYETNIDTYKDETITKFIKGTLELNDDNWAEFQNTMKTMGLDDCLAIRNAALQRAYDRAEANAQ